MSLRLTVAAAILAAGGLVLGGYAAGQKKFGQPKTLLHVVSLKWKDGVSDADKQKALAGIRNMAGTVPGVRNVWLKSTRVQPRDYDAAFAIEFENRAAAEAYAESPIHEEWSKFYLSIRQESRSLQITNE